ncbi:MAG: hypothetical protein KKA05_08185 [Alphaproteobacteria bacterium]|nr:hypothetical protein [Alphaproteobacteria bacterium]MBU0859179.1 hypothetical protein [Alphaproteobacteria bacterium]
MFYVFDEIDVHEETIANEYLPPDFTDMPVYSGTIQAIAVFRNGEHTLPLTYDAVTALLRMETDELHAVELRKAELMKARNAFVSRGRLLG